MQTEDLLRPHEPAKLAPLVVPPISSRSSETEQQDVDSQQASCSTADKCHAEHEQQQFVSNDVAARQRATETNNGPSPIASDLSSPSVSPTDGCTAERGGHGDAGDAMATKKFVANVVKPGTTEHLLMAAPLAVRPRFEPAADLLEGIGSVAQQGAVNVVQPPLGTHPSVLQPRPPAAARSTIDGAIAVSAPQLHGRRRQFFSSRGTAVDGGSIDAPSAATKLADLRGGTGSARPYVPVAQTQQQGKSGGVRAPPPLTPADGLAFTQALMKPRPPERTGGALPVQFISIWQDHALSATSLRRWSIVLIWRCCKQVLVRDVGQ